MRVPQTVYDGYHFRSHLEVRWAVVFIVLTLPYEYEREGFDLDGLWYLPDFRLPAQDCWVEIEGQLLPAHEHEKALRLTQFTQNTVCLYEGSVRIPSDIVCLPFAHPYLPMSQGICPGGPTYAWGGCLFCLSATIVQDADASRLPCGCFHQCLPSLGNASPFAIVQRQLASESHQDRGCPHWWSTKIEQLRDIGGTPRLIAAYTAALSAYSEYGLHGAPGTAENDRTGEEV